MRLRSKPVKPRLSSERINALSKKKRRMLKRKRRNGRRRRQPDQLQFVIRLPTLLCSSEMSDGTLMRLSSRTSWRPSVQPSMPSFARLAVT